MEYKSTSLIPKKADILVLLLVCAMAFGVIAYFAGGESEAKTAIILRNGKEHMRVDLSLSEGKEYIIEGDYVNHISVKDGGIGVIESTCSGGVCIHSGFISEVGKSIVCLPNRMEIRIVGRSDVDVIVG